MSQAPAYTLWGFNSRNQRINAEKREGEARQFENALTRIDVHHAPEFEEYDYARGDALEIANSLARSRSWSFIAVDNASGVTAFTI